MENKDETCAKCGILKVWHPVHSLVNGKMLCEKFEPKVETCAKCGENELEHPIDRGVIKCEKFEPQKTAVRNEELIKLKVGKVLADAVDKQVFETPTDPVTDKAPTQNHSPSNATKGFEDKEPSSLIRRVDGSDDEFSWLDTIPTTSGSDDESLSDWIEDVYGSYETAESMIKTDKVKEFVKKLKEFIMNPCKVIGTGNVLEEIDKLAGSELI